MQVIWNKKLFKVKQPSYKYRRNPNKHLNHFNMKKYILGISLMIAVVVVAIAACSKSDSGSTPTKPVDTTDPTATKPDATVSIANFAFSPASVTVKAGGTVQWTNTDSAPHTATDLNGAFNSNTLEQGAKYSFKFATPGTYTYHCTIHSMMATATVVVTQ
jgi:plastocyanin